MIGAKSFEKAELKVVNNRQGMWAALNHSLVVALGANGTELTNQTQKHILRLSFLLVGLNKSAHIVHISQS